MKEDNTVSLDDIVRTEDMTTCQENPPKKKSEARDLGVLRDYIYSSNSDDDLSSLR